MPRPIFKLTKLYLLFKNNSLKIDLLREYFLLNRNKKNLKNQKSNLISK